MLKLIEKFVCRIFRRTAAKPHNKLHTVQERHSQEPLLTPWVAANQHALGLKILKLDLNIGSIQCS